MADPLMTVKDPETAAFLMATLSPSARKMVDNETWRTLVSSDEGDPDHILPLLFQALLQDLGTIGVQCNIDYDTLSQDTLQLYQFLNLCRVILPNTLYPIALTNESLREVITDVAHGAYSTGGTAITTWMDTIAGADGIPPMIDGYEPIWQTIRKDISSDTRFMDYLLTLYENLSLSNLTHKLDAEQTSRYTDVIRIALGRSVELSSRLAPILSEETEKRLSTVLKRFTRALVAPDDMVVNQYLFLNTTSTLPDDLRQSYTEKWNQFRVSFPLFESYYTERGLPLSMDTDVLWLHGLVITCRTEDDYKRALQTYFERRPHMRATLNGIDIVEKIYE